MTVQQLSAQDAQFLYFQTGDLQTHIMGIYIYDPAPAPGGKIRFRDIVSQVRARMHTSPVFRRKLFRLPLDFDHPYWVEDEHFDLEAHISHARLPEPGDWRQLCIHVARHFSRPMDMSRPLWDLYVIEGLDRIPGVAPGSYAVLHRVHHSAIDGTAGALMFAALNDRDPHGTPAVNLPDREAEPGRRPEIDEILTRATLASMRAPINLALTAAAFMPNLLNAFQERLVRPADERNSGIPLTRFNAPVSPHKMFDATTFALSDISALRKLVPGATINDVVLAICGGAMRRYLLSHGELPEESLVAVAPINTRPSDGQTAAEGNNISAMTLKLSTTIADPVERLRAIRAFTADAKEARAGLSARIMTDLSRHIPGATLAGIARMLSNPHLSLRQANVLVSNVPGPQQQLYMNGARLTHYYAMGPIANNMGLFLSIVSYNGQMHFSITSERVMLPDISVMKAMIEEEFSELQSRLCAGG